MTGIEVRTTISARPEQVWEAVRDIGSHAEWMADAEVIRFRGEQRSGVGTTFECDTKIGPVRLTDVMEITEWVAPSLMGVRHSGVVTGTGRFTLTPVDGGRRTEFAWEEALTFPWWLGGAVGARVAAPVMRRIWRGNVERLRRKVEGEQVDDGQAAQRPSSDRPGS